MAAGLRGKVRFNVSPVVGEEPYAIGRQLAARGFAHWNRRQIIERLGPKVASLMT